MLLIWLLLPTYGSTPMQEGFASSTQTNSDGGYRFRALPPGTYKIQVLPLDENFIPVYFGDVRDVEESAGINVSRLQSVMNIDFRLRSGGTISGRVYANKNRDPVAGLRIVAENRSSAGTSLLRPDRRAGVLFFAGSQRRLLHGGNRSEPGDASLRNRKYLKQFHDGRFDPELGRPTSKLRLEAFLQESTSHCLKGPSISGSVRSRYHNRPLQDVTLLFQNVEKTIINPFQATTGADGEFLVSDLPPGSYWVETAAAGQNSATR